MNDSPLEVDLLYACNEEEEEEERSFVRIPPSESRTQQTFAGHKWRCRSRPDGTLLVTVACGDADLFVTDLSPELGGPRRLELDNHTQTEAEAVWLDGESGARQWRCRRQRHGLPRVVRGRPARGAGAVASKEALKRLHIAVHRCSPQRESAHSFD